MRGNSLNVPLGCDAPLAELLLADIAIRIELAPSKHQLAVQRFNAVAMYLEREGSPLKGLIELFYPQGSMAIGATIESWRRAGGHDIDIVAELLISTNTAPGTVLDALYEAINGGPGTRYHGKVDRQTRCVTVRYDDGMHLDVTPSVYSDPASPRESVIFHAKPEEPASAHSIHTINSYAFVRWVESQCPLDVSFAEAYDTRRTGYELKARQADQEPVPEHSTEVGGKSVSIVALQLLKRHRNVQFERGRRGGRMPPSVMLSKLAADVALTGTSILDALERLSTYVRSTLHEAQDAKRLVDIRNPCCARDVFTDRWPENLTAQGRYIDDLDELCLNLDTLKTGGLTLSEIQSILVGMFGEEPTASAVRDYAASLGAAVESNRRSIGKRGKLIAGASAAGATQASGHTFYQGHYTCHNEPFGNK